MQRESNFRQHADGYHGRAAEEQCSVRRGILLLQGLLFDQLAKEAAEKAGAR